MGNGLSIQGNLKSGIYPERSIFYVEIGMILIGSKRIREDPGLFLLHFTGRDTGSFGSWGKEGKAVVYNFLF